jgi:DNA-binding Xre family transcriptional regulator
MENEIQQELFKAIRKKIPEHLSAADEIGKILGISSDSAYRRMRGEKPVTLDELHKICSHYKVSVDQLMNIQTDAFLFFGKNVNPRNFSFNEYLGSMMDYMLFMQNFKSKELFYLSKDIPFFHHFLNRDLAAFKYYFWMKTLFQFPEFATKKFSLDDYPDETYAKGRKILQLYNQLTSYELWNFESLNSTLHQIEFYYEANMFASDNDAVRIYDALEQYLNHLEKQAELGYKFSQDDPAMRAVGSFKMYFNEVVTLDNSILAVLDGTKISFLTHSIFNFMVTRDLRFCEYAHENIQTLMRKSTLISSVSEKERLRFFNRMREKIHRRRKAVQHA